MNILIADDHTILRQCLTQILHQAMPDSVLGEAGNAQEILAQVAKQHWDVIVLDLNLPGRNGLDVLKELKHSQPQSHVLILSGYAEEEYAVRAIRLGAAGYLTKDRALAEVIQAVQKIHAGGKYITPSVAEQLAGALDASSAKPLHESLSDREFEVLRQIVGGQTLTQIAEQLGLSIKTVSTYRKRIADKTGLKSDAELVRYALEHKLID